MENSNWIPFSRFDVKERLSGREIDIHSPISIPNSDVLTWIPTSDPLLFFLRVMVGDEVPDMQRVSQSWISSVFCNMTWHRINTECLSSLFTSSQSASSPLSPPSCLLTLLVLAMILATGLVFIPPPPLSLGSVSPCCLGAAPASLCTRTLLSDLRTMSASS